MSFSDTPVISGRSYQVTTVSGAKPKEVSEFLTETTIVVEVDGDRHEVLGSGTRIDGSVRFYQKDDGPDGKDIRVWCITQLDDGTFCAEPLSHF